MAICVSLHQPRRIGIAAVEPHREIAVCIHIPTASVTIPVADLSKENVEKELLAHNVDADKAKAVIRLLDDCEYARFAPGDDTGRMDRLYDEAVSVIGQIENAIK